MNIGAGQTGSTCWLFSSINIFLLSDNGLKIMWHKLQEVYSTLKPRERAFFESNITAPCPYKGSILKTSSIYFWKFLNQYICAIGGPGGLVPKSGLNAYLTKNIKWRGGSTRESKGTSGGFPSAELPVILGHLGFRVGRDFRMVSDLTWRYRFKNNSWTAPILMYRSGIRASYNFKLRDIILEKKGYDLTGAIVYVAPALDSGMIPHVWACTIRNGKGYICNSNFPTTQIQCKWWLKDNLESFFMTVDEPFRPGRAHMMGFDVIMYTRNEFTNKISPTCRLPAQYRPLTANNREKLNQLQRAVNFLKTGRVGNVHERFTPRVLTEVIRRNANRPIMTANVFNKLVNQAMSFQHGINMSRVAKDSNGRIYRINKNGRNYNNFMKKLAAKFYTPVPKHMFNYIWINSKSNTEFVNRIRRYAHAGGYTINEKQLNSILATRAKTRAGAKRKRNAETERIYRAGNNWYNNKGNNVTNQINRNNWVLNETPNKSRETAIAHLINYTGNLKTYRRK